MWGGQTSLTSPNRWALEQRSEYDLNIICSGLGLHRCMPHRVFLSLQRALCPMAGFAMTDFTGAPRPQWLSGLVLGIHTSTPHVYIGVYSLPLVGEEALFRLSQGRVL